MDGKLGQVVTAAVADAAETLFRVVADTVDPIEKAQVSLEVVTQIQERLLPDMANIRRAAMRGARNRMSAQELADRLGISRARVYAVLAEDDSVGPLTITYRTANGGIAEARVSWEIDGHPGGPVRVTREEIQRRWGDVTVVVSPGTVETSGSVELAIRALESEAAHELGEADQAAEDRQLGRPHADHGKLWQFRNELPTAQPWPGTRHVLR